MLAERGLNFELESMQGRRHWVDCSTPLLPEVIPEIDANPVSFYWGGERVGRVWSLIRQSLPSVNFNDNAARDDAASDDNTVL